MTKHDIQTAFLSGESLKGYVTSGLTLRFLDGYEVWVKYEFPCCDENKQETEGFSSCCMEGVQSRLEELGYRMESINSEAEKMDMEWLGGLESVIFR